MRYIWKEIESTGKIVKHDDNRYRMAMRDSSVRWTWTHNNFGFPPELFSKQFKVLNIKKKKT